MECLVKKLKGVVENDNLKKFNVLYFSVFDNEKSGNLMLIGKVGTTISTTGNGKFTVDSDATERTSYTFSSNAIQTLHFSAGDYKIEMSDESSQNLNILNNVNTPTCFGLDLSQLNYVNMIYNFRLRAESISGTYFVNEFVGEFCIYGNNVNADKNASIRLKDDIVYTRLTAQFGSTIIKSIPINIERLGQCIGLSAISADVATDISGELDTLFAALHTAGKVSGNLDVYAYSGNVTDDGNTVNLNYIIGKGGTNCIRATFTSEGYTKTYR